MKFEDARKQCEDTCGGVIGYPSDDSDLGFFASIGLNAGTWIGATDMATEAAWITPDKTYYTGLVHSSPGIQSFHSIMQDSISYESDKWQVDHIS